MTQFMVKAKVWRYPGFGGWHFVTINKKMAKQIRDFVPIKRGFGSIRVKAQIGKSKWTTSIFPTKEKEYFLAIKAEVRKAENIKIGDTVKIDLKIDY